MLRMTRCSFRLTNGGLHDVCAFSNGSGDEEPRSGRCNTRPPVDRDLGGSARPVARCRCPEMAERASSPSGQPGATTWTSPLRRASPRAIRAAALLMRPVPDHDERLPAEFEVHQNDARGKNSVESDARQAIRRDATVTIPRRSNGCLP